MQIEEKLHNRDSCIKLSNFYNVLRTIIMHNRLLLHMIATITASYMINTMSKYIPRTTHACIYVCTYSVYIYTRCLWLLHLHAE